MPYSHHAFGEHMQQITPDELIGGQLHDFALIIAIINVAYIDGIGGNPL
jgi:hypothetical protein